MKKEIVKHKKFLAGVVVGLIPCIIMIGGWRVLIIVASILLAVAIVEAVVIASEAREEQNLENMYRGIERELKNISPDAYSKIELKSEGLQSNFYGKALNALIAGEDLRFYARSNQSTRKVQIIVKNELGETVYEDSITCQEFKKIFTV